jgi:hypothetical protein
MKKIIIQSKRLINNWEFINTVITNWVVFKLQWNEI